MAALLVFMLLVGPRLIADDKAAPAGAGAGSAPYASSGGSGRSHASGKALFVTNCGSCHTLAAARTHGRAAPALDGLRFTAADVETMVREGGGGMPAFGDRLSKAEIRAVAAFVARSR
ncbi:MAG: cytochrome c [Actinomycetota bacterium]|nr:cytochrome c [Actinomycetota bacterium]